MKNVVLINASPKMNNKSVSKSLVEMVGSHIDEASANKKIINIRQSITNYKTQEVFEILSKADAVIFAFPLYVFCMPGILMRFLEDYDRFFIEHGMVAGNAKE